MPCDLRDAANQLVGGVVLNNKRMKGIAKLLGVQLQQTLRYPGPHNTRPTSRQIPKQLKYVMLMTETIRQVRASGGATVQTPRTAFVFNGFYIRPFIRFFISPFVRPLVRVFSLGLSLSSVAFHCCSVPPVVSPCQTLSPVGSLWSPWSLVVSR